ncbi:molybdopterin molybdotransferase MoeA [Kingella negevensis]|uniref:molybdopterin molybdotransferase MoeA n=1 Tax=Kingella negevensis TaxID=1522312 RepID=UPI00050A22AD|nr:gephyrin-like molybdotransferase Glp [Kingella negevensis]MDK4688726.1 molybdopterin molybdotransferase MoeA [Kingella negevensis]
MALTPVADLQKLILDTVHHTFRQPETIPVAQAAGRVLAQDIISLLNVPDNNVSAMDGYAFPTVAAAGSTWRLVGESAAGRPFTGQPENGACIRIMTGAVVPTGFVAVAMQENTETDAQGNIVLTKDTPEGNNIRFAGEEIQRNQAIFQAGRILNHADVLVLASLGVGNVAVQPKIRVAVLSTGDELVEPSNPITEHGQIYDSNRHMLMSRLRDLPVEIVDMGKIEDNLEAVLSGLEHAAKTADVVMTSGGVSVGDYDYLRLAIEKIGQIHHYKVAMKPGKPFVFGQLGESQAWYFGLPGNPISGYVGFDMFVKSALWRLCGASEMPQPFRIQAALTAPVKKSAGRMDIQRATLTRQADGSWTVAPCGSQDSHRVLGVSQANAFMLLAQESGNLAVGDMVEVQPFTERFL